MVVIPQVHLNGTSARELLAQLTDANSALEAAIDALIKTRPNGRDYYHTGNLKEAEAACQARINLVISAQEEIMKIAEGIAAQVKE